MDESRRAFLAGERPDDVYIFLGDPELADAEAAADRLAAHGERTANGIGIVVAGDQGRAAFSNAVGVDPMSFAGEARRRDGAIARTLTDGDCPDADGAPDESHAVRFLFAFVEARNEDAGGLYADGPVVHGYAACTCGTTYSERWLATAPDPPIDAEATPSDPGDESPAPDPDPASESGSKSESASESAPESEAGSEEESA